MSVPAHLYKYEPWSTQSLQNLKSQIIYFGSPLNFNDPYDCAITPHILEPNDAEVERARDYYLRTPGLPLTVSKERLSSIPTSALRTLLVSAAKNALRSHMVDFLRNRGVTCLSETNDNLLMWSHYGGRYRGFCLEFSTADPAFEKVKRVSYSKNLPSFSVTSMLVDRDFSPVLELFTTKAEPWAYEREWRAVHKQAGTAYTYATESLTGIFFGPDMDEQSIEIACLILRGQNERVALWKGTRSETEFKVQYERFSYTTHLDAKRMGLR